MTRYFVQGVVTALPFGGTSPEPRTRDCGVFEADFPQEAAKAASLKTNVLSLEYGVEFLVFELGEPAARVHAQYDRPAFDDFRATGAKLVWEALA